MMYKLDMFVIFNRLTRLRQPRNLPIMARRSNQCLSCAGGADTVRKNAGMDGVNAVCKHRTARRANLGPGNMNDVARWRTVAWGLQLKQIAFAALLAAPLAGLLALLLQLNVLAAIGGMLGLAFLIDVIGRSCCLVAPLSRCWPIVGSVGVQLLGLIGAIAFAVGLIEANYQLGLVLASTILIACQAPAAFLFTEHLADLAHELGQPELASMSRRIRSGLVNNLAAGADAALAALLLSVVSCLFSVVTAGYALYLL